jgi:hypothetical protein
MLKLHRVWSALALRCRFYQTIEQSLETHLGHEEGTKPGTKPGTKMRPYNEQTSREIIASISL